MSDEGKGDIPEAGGDVPPGEDEEEGRPSLLELLGNPRVRHVEVGEYIFQEGDKVETSWYILLGRVKVFFADEELYELAAQEVLGAQELLIGQLEYNTRAVAVKPCDLIRIDLDGFIEVMKHGGLVPFLKRVATTLEQARAALKDTWHERDGLVQRLRLALEKTQDELVSPAKVVLSSTDSPPQKEPAAPPYPDLREKLGEARRSNRTFVKLIERQDAELAALLEDFRQTLAKYPELEKNGALRTLKARLEKAVTRRSNIVIDSRSD